MKLTGQCKKDFINWYVSNNKDIDMSLLREESKEMWKDFIADKFDLKDSSMKYGVLVDFFDANDILINMNGLASEYWDILITTDMKVFGDEGIKTRHEARAKAIEAANNIYNKTS